MCQLLEAGSEYRALNPSAVSSAELSADASSLLPLLAQNPSLLIYTKSSPNFESLRVPFNTAVSSVPLAIVRPRTEAEVISVVSFCTSQSLPISILAGGHDFWGRSLVSDGVVLDMAAMDNIVIAEDRTYARIGGGVVGSNLLNFLESHDLCTPVGFCSSVGYVGWATGAGYGLLQGSRGLGVDQILGARVVTADGQVIDTNDDPELLWAIRGAGSGTLGVIVEMRVKIFKNPRVLGGLVVFDFEDIGDVLRGFNKLIKVDFPDAFSGDILVPHIPGIGRVLAILFAWPDSGDNFLQAEQYLEKVCGLGKVLLNTVGETTLKSLIATIPMVHCPYHFTSRITSSVGTQLGDIISENPPVGESVGLIIHNAHGKSVKPCADTSFGIRKPHLVIGIAGSIAPSKSANDPEFESVSQWAERIANRIDESDVALDTAYMNFTSPEEYQASKVYGEDTLVRLRKVKARCDPSNVFFKGSPRLS